MTIPESRENGPMAGAVSLRQDIVLKDRRNLRAACCLRATILIIAAIVGAVQLAAFAQLLPFSAWINSQAYSLTLIFLGATLFASAHVWVCRQRMEASEGNLTRFVSRLHTPQKSLGLS